MNQPEDDLFESNRFYGIKCLIRVCKPYCNTQALSVQLHYYYTGESAIPTSVTIKNYEVSDI